MCDFSPISKFQKYVISDRCKDTMEKSVVCYLKYYRGARDSKEVAEMVGKRHDHLLRDIGNYIDHIKGIAEPNFGVSDFFIESSYHDSTGRNLKCYEYL